MAGLGAQDRSTPALEEWLPTRVRAYRTGGGAVNPVPSKSLVKLTCTGGGPGNIDEHLEGEVDRLLALESGWLIYNTHALDGVGWGPVSSAFLEELLGRLSEIKSAAVVPAAAALLSRQPVLPGILLQQDPAVEVLAWASVEAGKPSAIPMVPSIRPIRALLLQRSASFLFSISFLP